MMAGKHVGRVDGNGRAYAGSQRQIQAYVNQCPEHLSFAIAKAFSALQVCENDIVWVSPLEQEHYAEYRDSDFLRAVNLSQYSDQLRAFWPRRGPSWDALARYRDGCILVEAKSHVPEIYGGGCGASERSRAKIQSALTATRKWLQVPHETNWLGRLYQSSNRYAYLYFLREVAKVPCYLANVYFTDDPRTPTSEMEWRRAIAEVNRELRLSVDMPYCKSVILPAFDHGLRRTRR